MTALLLNYFNKNLSEKIPAVILGLILDSLTLYALYDVISYHVEYFGI